MQNVNLEQKIFIESQMLSAESFASRIYNQIGQVRVGLNDPGFSSAELSQVVRTFQVGAHELVAALDRIQESLSEIKKID